MRSTDEMTLAIHARAKVLRREEQDKRIKLLGGASTALTAALAALIVAFGGGHRPAGVGYAAATLLGDGAGGYVLAGVVAFMAGVATAVTCIRSRNKNDRK